jgi:hypothetical protein
MLFQQLGYVGTNAQVDFDWYIPETNTELAQSPLNMLCSGNFKTQANWYVLLFINLIFESMIVLEPVIKLDQVQV